MNIVLLVGNLGTDVTLRYSQSGKAVANFRMATGDGDRTEWHNIVVFDKQAETCNEYLRKGRQVAVQGSLQTRSWEDQGGITRWTTEVVANRVQFLGKPDKE